MHPDLFSIGPLTVHSYGTLIVLGFLCGLGLIKLRSEKYNIPYDKCADLSFGLLITGFMGAKVFHWLIIPSGLVRDMKTLISDPVDFVKNLGNGFEFFGGIAIGVLFFIWFTKRHNLPRLKLLDLLVPSIPLAHMFGRFGCFLAGCCYGKPCHGACCVVFNDPHSLAPQGVSLHPTQLYEAVLLLVLTGLLLGFERHITRIHGRMISFYILGYTVVRFAVEYFRGDDRGTIPGLPLTGTQLIAILLAAGAVYWLIHLHKHNNSNLEPAANEQ